MMNIFDRLGWKDKRIYNVLQRVIGHERGWVIVSIATIAKLSGCSGSDVNAAKQNLQRMFVFKVVEVDGVRSHWRVKKIHS